MATAKKLMGVGFSAPQAQYASGDSTTTNLTALGTNQATALALPADVNIVGTTAASTGVILPASPTPGDNVFVYNGGANALSVYPSTGLTINALSANAAYSLATTKSALFYFAGTGWYTLLSA